MILTSALASFAISLSLAASTATASTLKFPWSSAEDEGQLAARSPQEDITLADDSAYAPATLEYKGSTYPAVGSSDGHWTAVSTNSSGSNSFPGNDSSSTPGNDLPTFSIEITHTGRPIPTQQIFIGIIASLDLYYTKQLPPQGAVPSTGISITFTAGLRHQISVDPLTGVRVSWLYGEKFLKQLALTVFNKHVGTEVVFTGKANGRPLLRGVLSNPSTGGEGGIETVATS